MVTDGLAFIYHHGGRFVTSISGHITYEGGNYAKMVGVDEDTLDVFYVRDFHKELGYSSIVNLWWLRPGFRMDMKNGLRSLRTDQDLLEMCQACRKHDGVIHLYFEHGITEPEQIYFLCDGDSQPTQPPPCSPISTPPNAATTAPITTDKPSSTTEPATTTPTTKPATITTENIKAATTKNTKAATTKNTKVASPKNTKAATIKNTNVFTTKITKTTTQKITKPTKTTNTTPATNLSERKGPLTRSRNKGKEPISVVEEVDLGDSDSYDSYESTEDLPYKPHIPLDQLEDSDSDGEDIVKRKRKGKTPIDESMQKQGYVGVKQGTKEDDLDGEVSDGCNSYNSLQMRTPPSSEDDEEDDGDVHPTFNDRAIFGSVRLEEDMEFPTLELFKKAIRDYTIQEGREIRWVKNDKTRARVKCKVHDCPFHVFCSYNKVTFSWQIKLFVSEHTCCRGFRNKAANRGWVKDMLVKKLRKHPNLTHNEAFYYIKDKCHVLLNRTLIYRALSEAKKIVEGDEKEQYAQLWNYCGELLRNNPGSTVKLGVIPILESPPQFEKLYVCLDACKKGFKEGYRPLIGLDGAFLKKYYGGQILSAVTHDANNQIFVLAYAIVDVETKENWKWFLTLLHDDIGDYQEHGWSFISDMQKGLIPAMQEVMLGVHHRFCV